nr:cytochrome c [uncultured Sphingobacterium sp.]
MKFISTLFMLLSCCTLGMIACQTNNTNDSKTTSGESETEEKTTVTPITDFLKQGNKGIGSITSFEHKPFDQKLADEGNKLFIVKCTMCHEIKEDKIGPALYGVTKKRTPEWMMNMILNPDKMLAEDPDAQLLSKSYVGTMTALGLQTQEAVAILEYLRQEDSK